MFCPAGGAFFIFIFSIFAGHCDSIIVIEKTQT